MDDLLDLSRVTRGTIELCREHVTVERLVGTAVEAASPAFALARHSLEVSVPDEPIWLYADAARGAQVITNLLNKSAKVTPRGGRIVLTARQEGDEAIVEVRGHGIGIPRHALDTIFEMFYQVEHPGKPQGGLGIGLALVRRLVEMHGGTVHADSAGPERGASFVVRLPVAPHAALDAAVPGREAVSGFRRRLKVLIVDDNADLVQMLGMVVMTARHDVRKAFDGRTALSAERSYRPDVVPLDLGLPVVGGLDVRGSFASDRKRQARGSSR